ncbi:MAG: aminotransferase class V-fold PLP-dependent enzyme, partial [Pirellulaceae bacterium]|nr:aminotransferase class V-fold PLP-dependent enzyme [Pirellulaceae bacterium]
MEMIYLDHNAGSPTRPEVVEAMARCHAEQPANPAGRHRPGQRARRVLEDAREKIAEILGADLNPPRRDRLIFTSGGTEANNLAVLGIATAEGGPPGRVVISAGEHQSVIEPAEHLLEQGWRMDTLGLTAQGVVRAEQLPPLLAPDARLVSVLLANHETGVIQPIEQLASICNAAGVPLHT